MGWDDLHFSVLGRMCLEHSRYPLHQIPAGVTLRNECILYWHDQPEDGKGGWMTAVGMTASPVNQAAPLVDTNYV